MPRRLWLLVGFVAVSCTACRSAPFASWRESLARRSAPPPQTTGALATNLPAPEEISSNARIDILLAAAKSLENDRQYEEAAKSYERVLELNSKHPRALHRLAVAQERLGRPQVAQTYYERALDAQPANAALHCDYGYSCYLREDWPRAEQHYQEALRLQPQHKRAHTNYGMLLARTGREEQALGEFSRAGLSAAEARSNLAFAMSLDRRLGEAAEQYAVAVQLDPALRQAQHSSRELHGLMAKQTRDGAVAPASHESPVTNQLRDAVLKYPADLAP